MKSFLNMHPSLHLHILNKRATSLYPISIHLEKVKDPGHGLPINFPEAIADVCHDF